jgi:hypothetical protein
MRPSRSRRSHGAQPAENSAIFGCGAPVLAIGMVFAACFAGKND